jgi:hypothetical protein
VLGLGFSSLAASLTGYWDTDVTIDPTQTSFADAIGLTSDISVTYTVGDWAFTSLTTLTDTGWTGQEFDAAGVLGAFSIGSTLKFNPAPPTPSFTSWNTDIAVSIAGVSFGADFTLYPGYTNLVLTAGGVAGDVTVDGTLTLGSGTDCDFDFSSVLIEVGFPFCCADISADIMFDCSGFDYVEFTTAGIVVPAIPWLTLDATLTFTVDQKTLTITPNFDFGDFACFDIDISVAYTGGDMGALNLGNFQIWGIGLTCDIGGVSFEGYSTWDSENLFLDEYWEYYKIMTNDDGCCGPFGFDLAFYFKNPGLALFDVALIDANMTLAVSSQFTFNMGLMVDVDAGAFTQWTVGFLVTW